MAVKKSQIIIEVDDKSLLQLNEEIKTLDKSIKGLKVGTAEWIAQNEKLGKLKGQLGQATQAAKQLQGQVAKISFDQQLKSVSKLGAGMVGSFAAVSGSLNLISGNKAFDELTAKATTLMSVMGGINQVSELFSKTTLTGLKSIGTGFKGLVVAVKGASTAMKAALISTGIGALVVAVGLLIANWEKLVNIVKGTDKKALEAAKDREKVAENQLNIAQEQEKQAKLMVEINSDILSQEEEKLALLQASINTKDDEIDKAEKSLELLQLELSQIGKRNSEKNIQARKDKEAEIKLQEEKVQTLKLERDALDIATDRTEKQKELASITEKYNTKLLNLENKLTVAKSKQYSSAEQYAIELDIINIKIKQAQEGMTKGTEEERKKNEEKYKILLAELEARKNIKKENDKNLEDEIKKIDNQIEYNRKLLESNKALNEIYEHIEKTNNASELQKFNDEKHIELIKKLTTLYSQIYFLQRENTADANRNVKDLGERLDEYIKLYGKDVPLKITLEGVETTIDDTKKLFEIVAQLTEKYKEEINEAAKNQEISAIAVEQEAKVLALKELTFQITRNSNDILISSLESQLQLNKQISDNSEKNLQATKNAYELQTQAVSELQIEYDALAVNDEKRKDVGEKLSEAIQLQIDLQQKLSETTIQYQENLTENRKIEQDILDTKYAQVEAEQDLEKAKIDVIAKLKEEKTFDEKYTDFQKGLDKWWNEWGSSVVAGMDLVSASFDLIGAKQRQLAIDAQAEYDAAMERLSILEEAEKERQDTLDDYNEQLEDANGERYDQLLEQIALENEKSRKALEDIETERRASIDATNKKLKAEYQAAKFEKQKAVIDSLMNTALAIIRVFSSTGPPASFVLAGITAALAAVQIATIAAQKVPEPKYESYSVGGYTGDGDKEKVAGIVHKGEYVVPSKVVKSTNAQEHIAALETQRLKGYQEGGYVAPNVNTEYGDVIDYDRLINGIANAVKELPNPQVGLVDIANGLRRVALTQKLAGLRR